MPRCLLWREYPNDEAIDPTFHAVAYHDIALLPLPWILWDATRLLRLLLFWLGLDRLGLIESSLEQSSFVVFHRSRIGRTVQESHCAAIVEGPARGQATPKEEKGSDNSKDNNNKQYVNEADRGKNSNHTRETQGQGPVRQSCTSHLPIRNGCAFVGSLPESMGSNPLGTTHGRFGCPRRQHCLFPRR